MAKRGLRVKMKHNMPKGVILLKFIGIHQLIQKIFKFYYGLISDGFSKHSQVSSGEGQQYKDSCKLLYILCLLHQMIKTHSNNSNQLSGVLSPYRQQKDLKWQKTKSKFTRTQDSQRLDKKKGQANIAEQHRICFISPNRLKMTATSPNKPVYPSKYMNSPSASEMYHQESVIHQKQNEHTDSSKMDDSLLSMYEQLNRNHYKTNQSQIALLKAQLQNLKVLIEEQRTAKNAALIKVQNFQYIQQFLIERETYICDITQKNMTLSQSNTKLQQQKQSIQKQLVYFRNNYEISIKKNSIQVTDLKRSLFALHEQNKSLRELNSQFKQQIQQLCTGNNQSTTVISSFVIENVQNGANANLNSNNKQQDSQKDLSLLCCPSLNFQENQYQLNSQQPSNRNILQKTSYKQVLSSRSSRICQKGINESDYQNKDQNHDRRCSCSSLIKKLYQKIRYNQIQIDILKRIKGKGDQVESDNQKLKKQIKSLTSRIEYMTEKKRQFKKRQSDSSLELSLSLKKQSHLRK